MLDRFWIVPVENRVLTARETLEYGIVLPKRKARSWPRPRARAAADSAAGGAATIWFCGGTGGANLQVGVEDLVGGGVDAA